MEILILKNGEVFARATDVDTAAEYSLMTVADEDMPVYPETSAGRGKTYELGFDDSGALKWVIKDRELTQSEKLEVVTEELDTYKYAWKAGEPVVVGDRRYYDGKWYVCLQSHTTQAGWEPTLTPALWQAD